MPRALKFFLTFLFFSICCTFWLWGARASTAAAPGETLTLPRILELALEQNLDIQSSRKELLRWQGKHLQGEAGFIPRVELSGSAAWQDTALNGDGDKEHYGGAVTLTQPLYEGGKNTAKRKQAEHFKTVAEQGIQDTTQQVLYQVLQAYYNVLLAKDNVHTAEDALAYAREHLRETERKRMLGIATNFEVIRAEQQESSGNTDLITAKNQRESSVIELLTLLMLPQHSRWTVEGELTFAPAEASREEALRQALALRPDLRKAQADVEVQRQQVTIEASGAKPRISVYGKYSYDDPSSNYDNEEDTWSTGITVSVPLFNTNEDRGKALIEEATLQQKELGIIQKREEIEKEIAQAFLNLKSAAEAVTSTGKNLTLARESLRLAEVGYREGVGTQLDVLDAQTSLTQATKEHSTAIKDHAVSVIALQKAQGILGSSLTVPQKTKGGTL